MNRTDSTAACWLAVLVVIPGTEAHAQNMSRVSNTPHNLNTADVWGVTIPDNQVCLPCHTPHHAQTDEVSVTAPLWNHEITTQTFQMYTTTAGHQGAEPGASSKLCLSCHDGVTAIDSFGGNEGYFNDVKIPPGRPTHIGTDLTDDHPIGIVYPPPNLTGYNPKSTFVAVRVVSVDNVDRVECNSCHDPHNNSLGKFLRQTTESSALCFECHAK